MPGGQPALAGVPQAAAGTIRRAALDHLLEGALHTPLTVVCAGAGWGKTTALTSWLTNPSRGTIPVAWVAAHPGTQDPASFWERFIEALRGSGGVPAGHPLAELSASAGVSEEVLTSLLHGLDSLPSDVLLVVDDLQEVTDPAVLRSLSLLAERTSRVRLVVLTREVPRLPRHRLRLAGRLLEITTSDLAFTVSEILRLASTHGLAVSDVQAADLLATTEGWPAGVRLALLHASRHGCGTLVSFPGSERSVADYLTVEVLGRTSTQAREFLRRTSVVPRVSAPLAQALVPGAPAQQILETLEARNQFVTALGPDRTWFRYHPLLRDVLQHSSRRDDPDVLRAAHRAAGEWWATHGDPLQGLRHASQAEDWELFSWIYTQAAGPSLVGPGREALAACLRGVPYDSLPDSLDSRLQQAGLALLDGQGAAVTRHCARARELARHEDEMTPSARVLLELLTLAGHRFQGNAASAVAAGTRAAVALDGAGPFPAATGYRLVGIQNLGVGRLWCGDVDAAIRDFTSVLELAGAEATGTDLAQLGAQSYLALALLARGELSRAVRTATDAVTEAASKGWSSLLQARPAHLVIAIGHLLRGEADLADAATAAGLAAIRGGSEPPSALWLHCLSVEIAAARHRSRAADHALRTVRQLEHSFAPPDFLRDAVDHAATEASLLTATPDLPWHDSPGHWHLGVVRASCAARLRLARGDHVGARRLATSALDIGGSERLLDQVAMIEAHLVVAQAQDLDWRSDAALETASRAVLMARPQQLVHPFLTTRSTRVTTLLQRLLDRDGDPFVADIVGHRASRPNVAAEPDPLMSTLTERELAMLSALPTMKSNAEIAADFYVSVNTVKAHLKGLYRKLEVSSRREAVERARGLGLLS